LDANMPARRWSDDQLEQVMAKLLRAGVILAAACVFAGGVRYLVHYSRMAPDYRVFRGEPADLRQVKQIVRDALSWHARGLIQLGLLLLIATPVARVAFSVAAFAAERDWLYVGVTLIVLAILVYSLTGSS
jgi:uncharacterized membrane protein